MTASPTSSGNQTQFHLMVPDRHSLWRALALFFRMDLLDDTGVRMEDMTDLLDIVRFCRAHQEAVEVPVQTDGYCRNEVLANLFEQVAGLCQRLSPEEFHDDLVSVPDFQLDLQYRSRGQLTTAQISELLPYATSAWRHRWVTRGCVDPDDSEITYLCEIQLIDPFDLKVVDGPLRRMLVRHLQHPEAYVNDPDRVRVYLPSGGDGPPQPHARITFTFGAGFITQYALATMARLAEAMPEAGILGGTPDDAALPATVPLCEDNLHNLSISGEHQEVRLLAFLEHLLGDGLLATPGEETVTTLQLARGGRALPPLKEILPEQSRSRGIIDEAMLQRGYIAAGDYLTLVRSLLQVKEAWREVRHLVRLATHASAQLRHPEEGGGTQALLEDAAFRARTMRELPEYATELRETFDDADHGRHVHIHLDTDEVSGNLQLCLGAHWRFEGYLPQALADLAAQRGFGWVILEPGRYLFS